MTYILLAILVSLSVGTFCQLDNVIVSAAPLVKDSLVQRQESPLSTFPTSPSNLTERQKRIIKLQGPYSPFLPDEDTYAQNQEQWNDWKSQNGYDLNQVTIVCLTFTLSLCKSFHNNLLT